MKRVSSTNDTVKTMKGKAIDLEKIFRKHVSNKGQTTRINKEL